MATTSRNIRVADELWAEAKTAAAARGITVTAYVVGKLRELVEAERVRAAFVDGLAAPATDDAAR